MTGDVAQQLRQMEQLRRWLELADRQVQQLTPVERMILDMMILHPQKGNAALLCQLMGVEERTVYRRRSRLLEKFRFREQ